MMRKIAAILVLWALVCDTTAAEEVWRNYVNGNSISTIAAQDDYIWCVAQGNLVRWNVRDSTYTQFTPMNGLPLTNPEIIAPDHAGGVWVSDYYSRNGVAFFDDVTWKKYDKNNNGFPSASINALLPDSKGNVWFGTQDAGIVRFDGAEWKTYLPDTNLNSVPEWVVVDRNGLKWITLQSGVCAFDGVNYRTYNKEDGLAGNTVRRIAISPDGSLWFCTTNGVSRYDGTSWKTWSKTDGLVNNTVSSVAFAADGAVWVATDGGVSRFDGGSWKSFTVSDLLISDKSSGIAVDRSGKVWVCHPDADNGVSCYDGVEWKWYSTWNSGIAGNRVSDIIADRDGVVWFATDSGISSFDGADWKRWTVGEGLASDQVSGISVDEKNRKWILYSPKSKAGVSCFDGISFTTLTERDGLRSNLVWSSSAEGDTLWFCTGRGLCSFDGSSWKRYPGSNRLISKTIRDIAEDKDGALWFATDRGLTRFDNSGWQTYTQEDGLPVNVVTSVAAGPDGRIWMVADSTVVEFDGKAFRAHPQTMETTARNFKKFLSNLFVDNRNRVWTNVILTGYTGANSDEPPYALFRLDGEKWELYPVDKGPAYFSHQKDFLITNDGETVWTCTLNGLLCSTSRSRSLYRLNCPVYSYARDVVVDSRNVKWFSSGTTLVSFDDSTWNDYPAGAYIGENIVVDRNDVIWIWEDSKKKWLSFDGKTWNTFSAPEVFTFPNSTARNIVLDHTGEKWIAYDSGGAVSFDGADWTLHTTLNGLASDQIRASVVDADNLKWFATSAGVSILDGQHWKTYTTADGLASNDVHSMAVDNSNAKWFGTTAGITRFDGKNWKTYTTADGLPGNWVKRIAAGSGGILWVATDTGIARFDGQHWKSFPIRGSIIWSLKQFVVDRCNTLWTFEKNQLVSVDQDSVRYHGEMNSQFISIDRNNMKWLAPSGGTWEYIASLDDRPKPAPGEAARAVIPHQNYPNPFNARTNITFELYSYGRVEVEVYNLLGQKVRTLVSGVLDAGSHHIPWDGTDSGGKKLSSGIYFYRIAAQGRTVGDKMLFLK